MPIKYTEEQLETEVLHILNQHRGKRNPINRWELVRALYGPQAAQDQSDGNGSDREIRDAVERLRGKGFIICDLGDGRGRYLAESEDEFREFYDYYIKPIKARSVTLKAMKLTAVKTWPNALQPSLFAFDEMELV